MKTMMVTLLAGALGFSALAGSHAYATNHGQKVAQGAEGMMGQTMMSPGLILPNMDAARGRQLFASKGCVVCHSVSGVGGEDAPALDASTMAMPMNPFDFAAKMWRGAEAMVALQREELGEPIELTGQELADIVAFVHDAAEQKKFSDTDIPLCVKGLMHHMSDGEQHEEKGAARQRQTKVTEPPRRKWVRQSLSRKGCVT